MLAELLTHEIESITSFLEESNIALNKPAIQSSILELYSSFSAARNAFDGNKNQDFFDKSCSHTKFEPKPWLQVDLEKKALIRKVVIYNRAECCAEKFQNANVTVADTSDMLQNKMLCVHISAITTPNNIQTFACADDIIGRFVRITNGDDALHLCEVEVIGTYNIC